jgi:hypothetical protein
MFVLENPQARGMKFTRKQHGMDQPKDAKLQFAVRK